ncbi:hypothetical protein HGM15179_002593 [Zosterops borbonicus]|uniref:Chemokine interleukin-8-like domain-containing protein n=1 Tax=Zosterops borbonicus TaxID=364589 RepID=A0A8K1GWB9_9PASS|nr:hypothetical protein HGM15179_002593 [Zosterops borbonicus]
MKISLALLILLLAAACTGNRGFHSSGSKCCKNYYPGKISESKIQDYNYTPSNCNLTAVRAIFVQINDLGPMNLPQCPRDCITWNWSGIARNILA